ncbi:RNA recognition motif 2-domain-containing protein [Zychaea mexicana]|uniref:RNA recognition motif 2-domain-containing protein n=1 Tax=Zychaea mexicana TaxID=64656 RepID=UPI0022FDCCB0|nr:RNA recognition motif 2-domain-containing protein [Zychaea mexicana]XP_052975307.1 RNA recognition motif 2-domain-containing protein [Zychaea mexicana]KAI9484570.1 RNA recognition motif 2-domain-containing protein [Zychaea mexicana]KAI9489042.1 RNA recognition motif 2-domain-containing protein [Zychaea mexicana]
MINNIPRKYTQQMLKEEIDATNKGTYDFLFLSFDSRRNRNVGYAFVNFINVGSVITFAKNRIGKRWNRFNSEDRCSIEYGNTQGTVALVRKYKDERVVGEDHGPKLYITSGRHIGEEEPFPFPVTMFMLF